MPGGVSSMRSLLAKWFVALAAAVPAPAVTGAFRVPDDNAAAGENNRPATWQCQRKIFISIRSVV
jgi:hypothetical protein